MLVVGVGSGGVWKTTNAGVTFTPIFDDQPSYSIGEIALAPSNPEIVWVGTGENVSGRHVAWGTGVYRSRDGGDPDGSLVGDVEAEQPFPMLLVGTPLDPGQHLLCGDGPPARQHQVPQ